MHGVPMVAKKNPYGENRAARRKAAREFSPRRFRRLAKRLRVAAAKRECQAARKSDRQIRRALRGVGPARTELIPF